MFIRSLASDDSRFKTLHFRDGLNILVADRTETSAQGDSRNSSGKTSFVRILRYLFGGDLPEAFRTDALADHSFTAVLDLPQVGGHSNDTASVTRAVSRSTRVAVSGWSAVAGARDIHIDDWRAAQALHLFGVPEECSRPTAGQLWGQLVRTFFDNPTKVHHSEPDWESGTRIGHLLGLSPQVLGRAAELEHLKGLGKALRKAVKEGAVAHLGLDESEIRSRLATARRTRDGFTDSLQSFRVDEEYAVHQRQADRFTAQIQGLNDEGLALERRARELSETLRNEVDDSDDAALIAKVSRAYADLELVLPDAVKRRYDEVAAFHRSVVRNRQAFLQQEVGAVAARLAEIEAQRRELDRQRADVLRLLNETVALDTFVGAQRTLAAYEAEVADLERRLEAASAINSISDSIKLGEAELAAALRIEITERAENLDVPLSLFSELGAEIYTDREASLLVSPTPRGLLKVDPRVSGDASTGVRNVETFMLDIVCMVSALATSRAPRILVHDSHLFDSVDARQVASCLNIGARLAEEHGFQYIVAMNSDALASVESQTDGAFDPEPYLLETRLTDSTDDGGLFGFRFD